MYIFDLLNVFVIINNIRYLSDIQHVRRWIYNNSAKQGFNFTDINLMVNHYDRGNTEEKIMLVKDRINPHRLVESA